MTGLRSRLEAVEGVESIELELGTDGLEGITVRLLDGADEVAVLEGIRRLLVAYGTKLPREPLLGEARNGRAAEEPTGLTQVIDLTEVEAQGAAEAEQAARVTRHALLEGSEVSLSVRPVDNRSAALVHIRWGEESARRQVPASARPIVQAVIDLASELRGVAPIEVIGMNLSDIGSSRLLTVIVGNHGEPPKVCTATVMGNDWPEALLAILRQVVGEPSLQA